MTQRLKVVPSSVAYDIADIRPGDRLNGFKNSKTQLFNSGGGVK